MSLGLDWFADIMLTRHHMSRATIDWTGLAVFAEILARVLNAKREQEQKQQQEQQLY